MTIAINIAGGLDYKQYTSTSVRISDYRPLSRTSKELNRPISHGYNIPGSATYLLLPEIEAVRRNDRRRVLLPRQALDGDIARVSREEPGFPFGRGEVRRRRRQRADGIRRERSDRRGRYRLVPATGPTGITKPYFHQARRYPRDLLAISSRKHPRRLVTIVAADCIIRMTHG